MNIPVSATYPQLWTTQLRERKDTKFQFH